MKTLKLGIIGAGFVGGAVSKGFDRDVEQFIVDPKLNNNTVKDLVAFDAPLTFACLPTPPTPDGGVDSSLLDDVLSKLAEQK